MSAKINSRPPSKIPPPPIMFRVRYIDGTPDATRGSLEDLPFLDLGTLARQLVSRADIDFRQFASALTLGTMPDTWTTGVPASPALTAFETALETGDFVVGESAVSEEKSAEDLVRAIQSALAEGAYLYARELSAEGARRYPEHVLLGKYARVLAPPRVIRKEIAKKTDLRLNRDWIMQNGDAYRGKWIALRNGELRGAADSLRALFDGLNGDKDVFVTKVF